MNYSGGRRSLESRFQDRAGRERATAREKEIIQQENIQHLQCPRSLG